jgi:hypothetical protein
MRKSLLVISALALLGSVAVPASAAPTVFSGEDIMATTSSPHPLSAAAASSFQTAADLLGATSLITFEGLPLGSFTNLTVAPGVSIGGTDYVGNNQTILNSPVLGTLDGYNTTLGGAYFVNVQGGTLTFTFTDPIQTFGAYFSGLQLQFAQDTVNFFDGTSETLDIPEAGTSVGGVAALSFLGFTDPGASITSITIDADTASTGSDFIGVDDVLFGPVTVVPEPLTLSIFGVGLAGAAAFRRRKKKTA